LVHAFDPASNELVSMSLPELETRFPHKRRRYLTDEERAEAKRRRDAEYRQRKRIQKFPDYPDDPSHQPDYPVNPSHQPDYPVYPSHQSDFPVNPTHQPDYTIIPSVSLESLNDRLSKTDFPVDPPFNPEPETSSQKPAQVRPGVECHKTFFSVPLTDAVAKKQKRLSPASLFSLV
jgi:hypothetical protein